jgi:hypothetical protein
MGERWERFKEFMGGTDDLSMLDRYRDSFQRLGNSVLKAHESNEELSAQAGNPAYDRRQAGFRIIHPSEWEQDSRSDNEVD